MGRSFFKEISGVFGIYAAADLESPRICCQSRISLFKICAVMLRTLRIKDNNVSSPQTSGFVQFRVKSRVFVGDKVFPCRIARVSKASSHYLLYLSVVYIYARSESHGVSSVFSVIYNDTAKIAFWQYIRKKYKEKDGENLTFSNSDHSGLAGSL